VTESTTAGWALAEDGHQPSADRPVGQCAELHRADGGTLGRCFSVNADQHDFTHLLDSLIPRSLKFQVSGFSLQKAPTTKVMKRPHLRLAHSLTKSGYSRIISQCD
jgi:hypothetical protein